MIEREREGAAADSLRATYHPPRLPAAEQGLPDGHFSLLGARVIGANAEHRYGLGTGNRQMNEAWGASSQLSQGAGHGRAIRHVLSQRCQWVW